MGTYSRDTAVLRFEYDPAHPGAYGYLFEPTGGFTATSAALFIFVHGGGWNGPDKDKSNDRFPGNTMTNSTVPDIFVAGGAAFIYLEYPLGPLETPLNSDAIYKEMYGANSTHFPENWIALARAIQFIKDECESGGIFDGLIDPTQIALYGESAGASMCLFSQWSPASWGLVPRAPGKQVSFWPSMPRNDQYVAALALYGPPICPATDDPSRDLGSGLSRFPGASHDPRYYRPRVSLYGTLVEGGFGPLAVGDHLVYGSPRTHNGEVYSISGSGAATTVVLLVELGEGLDYTAALAMFKLGDAAVTFTITTPTVTDSLGWLDIPQHLREAQSPVLLLDQMTEADLDAIRAIPIWAGTYGNPSVQYKSTDSDTAMNPDKFGADDAHDVMMLDSELSALGGFTTEFTWGADADTFAGSVTQTFTDVTDNGVNPIVYTTSYPHGIQTGDTVKVGQVGGNTAANATFTATRISATTFSQAATGNGDWTSGGVVCFHNAASSYFVAATAANDVYVFCRDVAGMSKLA